MKQSPPRPSKSTNTNRKETAIKTTETSKAVAKQVPHHTSFAVWSVTRTPDTNYIKMMEIDPTTGEKVAGTGFSFQTELNTAIVNRRDIKKGTRLVVRDLEFVGERKDTYKKKVVNAKTGEITFVVTPMTFPEYKVEFDIVDAVNPQGTRAVSRDSGFVAAV